MQDKLGDYCKRFENYNSTHVIPGLPVYVRLDGRSFHTFTKYMKKPFDEKLTQAMRLTARQLVDEWDCKLAYVQSDEISLIFDDYSDLEAFPFFNGKTSKLLSTLASSCTAKFADITHAWRRDEDENGFLVDISPAPQFDCRIWQAPKEYSVKYLIWRQDDAIRNSVNMLYYHHLPEIMHDVNNRTKLEILDSMGIKWSEVDICNQRGSFFAKRFYRKTFKTDEIESLPPKHRARTRPNLGVWRCGTTELVLPPVRSITNLEKVIFNMQAVEQENA